MKKLLIFLSIFIQITKSADINELEQWSMDIKKDLLITDLKSNEYKALTSKISRDQEVHALIFKIRNLLENKLSNNISAIIIEYCWCLPKKTIKFHTNLFNKTKKAQIEYSKEIAGRIGFD